MRLCDLTVIDKSMSSTLKLQKSHTLSKPNDFQYGNIFIINIYLFIKM